MGKIQDRQDWLEQDDKRHKLARTLREGVEAMRAAARRHEYMYPNPGELEPYSASGAGLGAENGVATLYGLRVSRSDLPNPWVQTIEDLSRLPFRSRIDLQDWDEELQGEDVIDSEGRSAGRQGGWVENIDGCGNSIDQWAQQHFEDSMFEGVVFSFVDNDPRSFPSVADRRAAGARPYVTTIHRRAIRQLHWETVGGAPRLLYVSFDQPINEADFSDANDWTAETKEAIKVVRAGDPSAPAGSSERMVRTELWVLNESDGEYRLEQEGAIIPEGGGELLDIPLVPHYSKRTGPWRGDSPFLNTAWTQVSIWNHNSELSSLARESSMLVYHETGVDIDAGQPNSTSIRRDSHHSRYLRSTSTDATFAIHESTGAPLAGIRELVEWKIETIEADHHQIQSRKPTVAQTASEITLEAIRASSALELWIIQHEHSWMRVLDLMATLGGHAKFGRVTIEHDFGLPSKGLDILERAYISGEMDPVNFWNEMKRAGVVDERLFDIQRELSRWQQDRALRGPETL